jgi:hypothetical protein
MNNNVLINRIKDAILKERGDKPENMFSFLEFLFDYHEKGKPASRYKAIEILWPDEYFKPMISINFEQKK